MTTSTETSNMDSVNTEIGRLQSEERLQLLNDIDRFRTQAIDDLPQIVVCGDTSSGKSSVLQALSGIPFPTDSLMCTCFATEIALRYSSSPVVTGTATITPARDASAAHRERVSSFQRGINDLNSVVDIIAAAKEEMGLNGNLTISKDTLHLRLEGASLPDLTLVDLPGLIHSSRHQTDIDSVKELIETYFQQSNSIILTIVSAENPMESQGVLNHARKFDPRGLKSIGVITKPDQVDRGDKVRLRPAVLELARNQNATFKFRRPWHIVRCLGDQERAQGADRQALERKLFSAAPWNEFDRSQQGIDSLRKSLSKYLEERIIETLPELTNRLETRMSEVKLALGKLGEERSTAQQQRVYLTRLSQEYTVLIQKALSGDYVDAEFFVPGQIRRKIRAWMMNMTEQFEHDMRQYGHSVSVLADVGGPQSAITDPKQPEQVTFSMALRRINDILREHRGPELPYLYNPRLVKVLFVEQSRKWKRLALHFADAIIQQCRMALRDLLSNICQPADAANRVWQGVFDQALLKCQQAFKSKIDELLSPTTNGLAYCSPARFKASLLQVQQNLAESNWTHNCSENAEACVTFWQYSQAYYNVALETFIDNVVVLGAENCLFGKLEDVFSSATIALMDDDMLQRLGGENPDMIQERHDLSAQLETLQRACDTCNAHMARYEFTLHCNAANDLEESGRISDDKISEVVHPHTNTTIESPTLGSDGSRTILEVPGSINAGDQDQDAADSRPVTPVQRQKNSPWRNERSPPELLYDSSSASTSRVATPEQSTSLVAYQSPVTKGHRSDRSRRRSALVLNAEEL